MRLLKRARLRTVGGQALFLAVSAGLAQLTIALIFALAARATDPASLGIVVSAMALGVALAGLTDFGTNSYWVRGIARGVMQTRELGILLISKIAIGLVASVCLAVSLAIVVPGTLLWTAGLLGFATLVGQAAQTPLRGAALGHLASIVVIFDRCSAVLAYFISTALGVPAPEALVVALFVGPIGSAVLARYLTPSSRRPHARPFAFRWPWSGARNFGVSSSFIAIQTMDVIILSALAAPSAAGIYGAVNKWVQPVTILAASFASASAPFIARTTHARESWKILRQAVWIPVVAVGGSCCLALLAPWLVVTVLGEAYESAGIVLTILALAAIPGVLNQPLFVALQYLGRDRAAAFVLSFLVVLQLVLVALLAPSLGAVACALAVLSSQTAQLAAFLLIAVRELKRPHESQERSAVDSQ
ncbi:hypothetical protein ASH00_11670 [Arthrobacter sp. Soil782]|nr:hypothetical protein ASH00_11670 [Arthrobacter sp. Soil782]